MKDRNWKQFCLLTIYLHRIFELSSLILDELLPDKIIPFSEKIIKKYSCIFLAEWQKVISTLFLYMSFQHFYLTKYLLYLHSGQQSGYYMFGSALNPYPFRIWIFMILSRMISRKGVRIFIKYGYGKITNQRNG
jgi:hypothetical protein